MSQQVSKSKILHTCQTVDSWRQLLNALIGFIYLLLASTNTIKRSILSAIDDKWKWGCVAIPNLMTWLFCFIIFHEPMHPMPPHSPTAISDMTLPGAKPGHQIRQTKIHLRLARQAQGRCRPLTFFPIFDGGTPGCASQQRQPTPTRERNACPFYKRWHVMAPSQGLRRLRFL